LIAGNFDSPHSSHSAMKDATADNAKSLSSQIKQEAQRLGFELVGISPLKAPLHEQSFAEWLRQGLAGELSYMERTAALRREPRELVPWAASIVSVGLNYYTAFARPPLSTTN